MPRARSFPPLKESQVRQLVSPTLFAAGARLWQDGQVRHSLCDLREPLVMALVQERAVRVRHIAGDEYIAQCDCGARDLCAHAVSLLLAWANESYSFERVEQAPDAQSEHTSLRLQWRHYLQPASLGLLRAMARRLDVALNGGDRASLLTQIAERLAQPDAPARAIAALNETQRRVLQMLYLLSDGQPDTTAGELQTALGWLDGGAVDEALRELREWGLAVTLPSQWYRSDPYAVAPSVAAHVPPMAVATGSPTAFEQPRLGLVKAYEGDLTALERREAGVSIPEALLLARHLQLEPRPAPPDLAQARTVKLLRDWTYDVDEMVRLQVRPGWLHQTNSALSVPPPGTRYDDRSLDDLRGLTGDDALSDFVSQFVAPPGQEGVQALGLRELFDAWQRNAAWTELWELARAGVLSIRRAVLVPNLTYAAWLDQLARARRFITRALALLPSGQWHDADSFLAYIHTVHADFAHEPQALPGTAAWWLEHDGARADLQAFDSWRETYGAFVAQIIGGPLRWLGAAEIALERTPGGSRLRAFRITPVGTALLHGDELPPLAEPDRPLRLLDAQCAQLPLGRNDFHAYLTLERLARFDGVHNAHACYRFDEEYAHAAFEGGFTLTDVLAHLERLSDAPLPETLRARWQDWWSRYAQVRWYDDLTVLEFADDYMLQELFTQTDLREHILLAFGPRLVVVRPESADALTRQLVKKGYTPRIE